MATLRPILFSTPMVQVILRGDKTMTRRVVKPQPEGEIYTNKLSIDRDKSHQKWFDFDKEISCRYGKPGDILWVREAFTDTRKFPCYEGEDNEGIYVYKADKPDEQHTSFTWTPSIHMPREAARIFLRVKSVRVERLHDITEADAKAEGMERTNEGLADTEYKIYTAKNWWDENPINSFKSLWHSINGAESWNLNPFVWVVEFERLSDKEVKEMKAAEDWMKSCMDYAIEVHKTGPERKAKRIEEMTKAFIGDGIKLVEKPE